jgi:hypothetical protein
MRMLERRHMVDLIVSVLEKACRWEWLNGRY